MGLSANEKEEKRHRMIIQTGTQVSRKSTAKYVYANERFFVALKVILK